MRLKQSRGPNRIQTNAIKADFSHKERKWNYRGKPTIWRPSSSEEQAQAIYKQIVKPMLH